MINQLKKRLLVEKLAMNQTVQISVLSEQGLKAIAAAGSKTSSSMTDPF